MVLLPQFLLCSIIAPTSSLPHPLHTIFSVLPLTYSVNAMRQLTVSSGITGEVWRDMVVLVCFIVALLLAGAATLNRRTP